MSCSLLLSCSASAQQPKTLDFTNCESIVWNIDSLTSSCHNIIIDFYTDFELMTAVRVLVGDNLILVHDGIYDVSNGNFVRNISQTDFNDALRIDGLHALTSTHAQLDSEGRYLYALGISRVDGGRYHHMKKLDFNTGQMIDSIEFNSIYFTLDRNNNLLKKDDISKSFESLFPEINFVEEPTYFLYQAPRYSERFTYYIMYSSVEKKMKFFIYDNELNKLLNISGIATGGKVLPPNGLVGFNKKYLAYAEPIEATKKLSVTIFHLK